jgi:hypothetical protein
MKTSELIECLVADRAPHAVTLTNRFWLALGSGALISAAIFLIGVGPRADFATAAHTLRFDLKFIETAALAMPSASLCFRLMHPDAHAGRIVLFLAAPFLLLGAAVSVELLLIPPSMWEANTIGINSRNCLTLIPVLSIAPLSAAIYAMRAGASRHPALSGALAGAAAGGVAATIYASSCTDDSPLFVATWYPVATLVVVGVGSFAGRWLLRW